LLRNACLLSATSAESVAGTPAGDLQGLPLLPGARVVRDERDRDGLNAANSDTAASSADKILDSGALSVAPEPLGRVRPGGSGAKHLPERPPATESSSTCPRGGPL